MPSICFFPECKKWAQAGGIPGRCIIHGGGGNRKRCEEMGCTKFVQHGGIPNRCTRHGGGVKCDEPNCKKKARKSIRGTGKPYRCIKHGGGDRCEYPQRCPNAIQVSPRGTGVQYRCSKHGRGDRCEDLCCEPLSNPSFALFCHPETGVGLCTHAARNMVYQAIVSGDYQLADDLKTRFGFKRDLVLRAEHVFYYELVKLVPKLIRLRRVLDESVLSKLIGKTKSLEDPRPDYFHLYPDTNIGLHGEFDEYEGHEEDADRLRKIAHHAGCHHVYYFRVKGHLHTPQAVCRRVVKHNVAYYVMTDRGRDVLREVALYVEECVESMYNGKPPPENTFIKIF